METQRREMRELHDQLEEVAPVLVENVGRALFADAPPVQFAELELSDFKVVFDLGPRTEEVEEGLAVIPLDDVPGILGGLWGWSREDQRSWRRDQNILNKPGRPVTLQEVKALLLDPSAIPAARGKRTLFLCPGTLLVKNGMPFIPCLAKKAGERELRGFLIRWLPEVLDGPDHLLLFHPVV